MILVKSAHLSILRSLTEISNVTLRFLDLLKKNSGANGTRSVAILWGEIGDDKLVKKVLDVKYKEVETSFARGLKIGLFSAKEMSNVVEAVKKDWEGEWSVPYTIRHRDNTILRFF